MTKKAAKKKQTKKRAPKKAAAKSTSSKTSTEREAQDESMAPQDSGDPSADSKSQPQEIEVVEESPPPQTSSEPAKKIGRVPRSESNGRQDSPRTRSNSSRRGGRRGGGARPPVDAEELGRKAWKVFQQEIAEEGLALIDEISARQLAEKSITVTRAFLEERERRLGKSGKSTEEKREAPLPSESIPPPSDEKDSLSETN